MADSAAQLQKKKKRPKKKKQHADPVKHFTPEERFRGVDGGTGRANWIQEKLDRRLRKAKDSKILDLSCLSASAENAFRFDFSAVPLNGL